MFRQTHIVTCAVCKSPVAHINTLSVRQKSWGSTRWHSCTWTSLDSRKASKSKHESHNSTRNCPPHPFKPYQAKVSTKFDAETLRHTNASTVRNAQWTTTDKTGNSRDIYMTPYGDVSKPILLYFEGWTSINSSYFWVHYATRVLTHSYHIITILLPSTILASPRFPSVCLGLCANTAEVGAKRAHAEAVVLRIDSGRKYVLRNLERRSNVEMSIQ